MVGSLSTPTGVLPPSDRVWSVKLSDGDKAETNSDRTLRMSVWADDEGGRPLAVNEVCQKALELSPEWLIKITRRFQKSRKAAVALQYGGGLETILLVDGGQLPDEMEKISTLLVECVVASIKSEETKELAMDRASSYGVASCSDMSE